MGKIFLEANDAPAFAGQVTPFYHLYLVYQDDTGDEFVIRGGPSNPLPPFGSVLIENSVPIEDSKDNRSVSDRSKRFSVELDLDGRTAEDVWDVMTQQASQISSASVPYTVNILDESDNSNTVISSVLNAVGIDVSKVVSSSVPNWRTPGADTPFSDYPFGTTLNGTGQDDLIYGGYGSDIITGAAGNDTLSGAPLSGYPADTVAIDVLAGNAGNDLFKVADDQQSFYLNGENEVTGFSERLITDPKDYAIIIGYEDGDLFIRDTNRGYFESRIPNQTINEVLGKEAADQVNLDESLASKAYILDVNDDKILSTGDQFTFVIAGNFDPTGGSDQLIF